MTLQPVLVPVVSDAANRTPQRVQAQRVASRRALIECARRSGAPEAGWTKDENDVPRPLAGFHWSVSHKRHWAAAVIADRPVGIDIEHILPKRNELFAELAAPDEWAVLGDRSWPAFFRVWTAKEATLKANGLGIGAFGRCRVLEVDGDTNMTLLYDGAPWTIEHFLHAEHIVAVTAGHDAVAWHVLHQHAERDAS